MQSTNIFILLKQFNNWRLANLLQLWHFVLVGHAQDLRLLENLEALRVTREQRSTRYQLKQDAASRPDVNAAVVVIAAKDQLGCAIVA